GLHRRVFTCRSVVAGRAYAAEPHTDTAPRPSGAEAASHVQGCGLSRTQRVRQTSVTVMLPRVAFEYGQTWWAFSRRALAGSASTPGIRAEISTMIPKPSSFLPMPTFAVTVEPEMSAF